MALTLSGDGDITGLAVGALPSNVIGSGGILQVVQVVKTDTFSHNNGYTFTDVTGVSANITPTSTSSKILVMWNCNLSQSATTGTYGVYSRITRDGTVIIQGDTRGSSQRVGTSMANPNYNYSSVHSFQYLDSPTSSSTLNYKLQIAVETGSQILCGGSWQSGSAPNSSTPTSLILMEIAG
jgi:hypothetical protein